MKIGEIVQQYLTSHNMSQRQFAKVCGLSNGYISMLIIGKNPKTEKAIIPSLSAVMALATGMGMSLSDFLDKVDDDCIAPNVLVAARNTALSGSKKNDQSPPVPTEEDLQVALFGGEDEVTPEMWDEVKRFAEFVKEKHKDK